MRLFADQMIRIEEIPVLIMFELWYYNILCVISTSHLPALQSAYSQLCEVLNSYEYPLGSQLWSQMSETKPGMKSSAVVLFVIKFHRLIHRSVAFY